MNRKTPCEPIAGDPTKNTPPNTCHFCYKKMKNKYNLRNHFDTCKIKNGGMNILFDEIKKMRDVSETMVTKFQELTNEVKQLKRGNHNTTNNINVTDSNHHNTTINLQLTPYNSDAHGEIMSEILALICH